MPRPRNPRLLCATLLVIAACSPGGPAPTAKPQGSAAESQLRDVRIETARLEPWETTLRLSGELAPYEQATLSAKVAGRLEKLAVDLGSRVKQGELLAQVDAHDYQLRVVQAEAALSAARARLGLPLQDGDGKDEVEAESVAVVRQARAALDEAVRDEKRAGELLSSGVATQAAVDNAHSAVLLAQGKLQDSLEEVQNRRAQVVQRRADLALARSQLADTQVLAPFDGAVVARLAGTGDYLSTGASIARLVRFDPLRLRMEVPEYAAGSIQQGQALRALLEDGTRIEGSVARISPELGARNRTLLVEGELQNGSGALRPGSFVRVELVLDGSAQALVVPADALVRFAGIDKLFEVVDGKAVERRVSVGRIEGERVEVLEGLQAGAQLVLAPGNLQGGAGVRVGR
ncbi:MAG: efflux RND transporter periplasmic adaptor subunit [Planctomycetes bacterium]|nr:efflux RND transporter periplasmic adaptor subunit [Planctomycetota bacterium]